MRLEQVPDALDDDPRLAGAGARDDDDRPVAPLDDRRCSSVSGKSWRSVGGWSYGDGDASLPRKRSMDRSSSIAAWFPSAAAARSSGSVREVPDHEHGVARRTASIHELLVGLAHRIHEGAAPSASAHKGVVVPDVVPGEDLRSRRIQTSVCPSSLGSPVVVHVLGLTSDEGVLMVEHLGHCGLSIGLLTATRIHSFEPDRSMPLVSSSLRRW